MWVISASVRVVDPPHDGDGDEGEVYPYACQYRIKTRPPIKGDGIRALDRVLSASDDVIDQSSLH
jgi:hypothetical protein